MGKLKIAMYDLEGNLLEIFDINTIVELEKQLKIPQGNINSCISGKILSSSSFQFRKYTEKSRVHNKIGNVISIVDKTHCKPVHKYYNNKYINSYKSATEAAIKNNILQESINKCCNGVYKLAGGFEWKYAHENNIESFIKELKNKLVPTMGVLIELDKLKDKYSNF